MINSTVLDGWHWVRVDISAQVVDGVIIEGFGSFNLFWLG